MDEYSSRSESAEQHGEPEELAEGGARWTRLVWVLLAVVIVAVVVVRVVRGSGSPQHRATGPTPAPSASTAVRSGAPAPSGSPSTDDEYLLDVPAQDMRDALTDPACRHSHPCTAHVLTGAALARAVADFSGMRPLAGGLVTRAGSGAYLRTVEGYAGGDAVVHLYAERVQLPATGVRTTDSRAPDYRTLVLAIVRGGWRLTATLIVRGTAPPTRAAATWLRTSPLPT